MKSRHLGAVLVGLWAAFACPVTADEFGNFVYMSAIASNTVGHLCAGVPTGFMHYFDIQCPSNAPYVSSSSGYMGIGTNSPSVALEVSGTVSATHFVGDGSGLTGITAASSDRIVSTSANVVVGNGGTVSFSTGGVSGTAYLDSTGRMVLPGISVTTNQTSVTTLYASGNVGIRTSGAAVTFDISGTTDPSVRILTPNGYRGLQIRGGGATYFEQYNSAGPTNGKYFRWSIANSGYKLQSLNDGYTTVIDALSVSGTTGNVGISTTFPNAKLDVNGTISASAVYVTGTTGTVSATYGYFQYVSASSLSVGGSSLLTGAGSTGYVPYWSGSSGLTYDSTVGGQFYWDSSNHRLAVGTTNPSASLHISGTGIIVSDVAIGMNATPSATLDVSGTLKLAGTGTETCDAAHAGMIRVNPATHALQFCRE